MQNLIKDIKFNLYEVLNSEQLLNTERYKEHNIEIFDAVIDTAKKIAEDLFAPHNTKADEHEPSFDGENVQLIPKTEKASTKSSYNPPTTSNNAPVSFGY